jgi:hypothetical protein
MRRPTFVQFRTAALFAGGMLGVAYVTLVDNTDRPTLLILFGAMMGLPLFLRQDEKTITPPPPPTIDIPAVQAAPEAGDD